MKKKDIIFRTDSFHAITLNSSPTWFVLFARLFVFVFGQNFLIFGERLLS